MRKMTTRTCEFCKKSFEIRVSDVNRGRGRFCGKSCAHSGPNNHGYKHGNSSKVLGKSIQTKEYKTWSGVKQRTTNPNSPHSEYYFGRGIKMCERWLSSFENFLSDLGPAPSKFHSIDRIDVNGDYEPGNCRWATKEQQMRNTRANTIIEFQGIKLTQEEWGQRVGLTGTIVCKRLKRGWSVERALTTPRLR